MLSIIGFMVGVYILARALSFTFGSKERGLHPLLRVVWVLAGLITTGCLVYFVKGGGT